MSKTFTLSPEATALLSAYHANDGNGWDWSSIQQTHEWEDFTASNFPYPDELKDETDDETIDRIESLWEESLENVWDSACNELKEKMGIDIG